MPKALDTSSPLLIQNSSERCLRALAYIPSPDKSQTCIGVTNALVSRCQLWSHLGVKLLIQLLACTQFKASTARHDVRIPIHHSTLRCLSDRYLCFSVWLFVATNVLDLIFKYISFFHAHLICRVIRVFGRGSWSTRTSLGRRGHLGSLGTHPELKENPSLSGFTS